MSLLLSFLNQSGLLGVFQKLIASKTNDHEGFYILNTLVESVDQWVDDDRLVISFSEHVRLIRLRDSKKIKQYRFR